MASWAEVEASAGDLALRVKGRFEAHGLALLATNRRNGYPRISGIEPLFREELWLGMMPDSRKALDLLANPKMALHSATSDRNLTEGDARVTGLGVPVGEDEINKFRKQFADATGTTPPPGPMNLFRVDIKEISFLGVNVDHLVIDWWKEGAGVQSTRRY